jgi:PTS system N-acetylgalactosamine-specific IIA component
MVSAVDTITGRGAYLEPVSVAGLCADDIEQRLLTRAAELGVRVIFTDLPAGSCTVAVRRLLRSHPQLVLVTGANLATLVDFVFHGDLSPTEAAQRAAERGRGSISVVGGAA